MHSLSSATCYIHLTACLSAVMFYAPLDRSRLSLGCIGTQTVIWRCKSNRLPGIICMWFLEGNCSQGSYRQVVAECLRSNQDCKMLFSLFWCRVLALFPWSWRRGLGRSCTGNVCYPPFCVVFKLCLCASFVILY